LREEGGGGEGSRRIGAQPAVDLEDTREGTGERGEEERDDREAAPLMTDAGGTSEGAEHGKERKDRENRDRDDRGAEEGAPQRAVWPPKLLCSGHPNLETAPHL
jgi:hypothetical protein